MYTYINFKTKKELKQAIQAGQRVGVYSPGPFPCPQTGNISLEGPHFPKPHTWYAQGEVKDGFLIKVK